MSQQQRPPSPRLTDKERFYVAVLEEAEERGVPLAQLAVERDVSPGTLSWWKGEIRRREALRRGVRVKLKNRRAEETIEFVPIELPLEEERLPAPAAVPEGCCFEVALPGGATVRVPDEFEDAVLTRVIRAVRAAC